MLSIFDFDDYKLFLEKWLGTMPEKRRGMNARIAKLLSIHTTMVSHILNDDAQLSVEQALKLCKNLFSMNPLETRYFVLLVQRERAGDREARAYFDGQLHELKTQPQSPGKLVSDARHLEPKDQAVFYSDWHFSGIRLITALPGEHTVKSIAQRLELREKLVKNVLDFLVSTGLVIAQNGNYTVGVENTYVDKDSMFVNRHHMNWRLKVLSTLNHGAADDLIYTNPVTISSSDFAEIRSLLIQVISDFRRKTAVSEPKEMACLNLDWVRVHPES